MLTARLAVKNALREQHNLWPVNVERSYHEEFTVDRQKQSHNAIAQFSVEIGSQPKVAASFPQKISHSRSPNPLYALFS